MFFLKIYPPTTLFLVLLNVFHNHHEDRNM